MRTWSFDIPITSRLLLVMKGFGGLKEVLQLMSYHGPIEQPAPIPIPNGYGMVTFPHWLGQPGFAMVVGLVIVVVELVEVAASRKESHDRENKARGKNMFGKSFPVWGLRKQYGALFKEYTMQGRIL